MGLCRAAGADAALRRRSRSSARSAARLQVATCCLKESRVVVFGRVCSPRTDTELLSNASPTLFGHLLQAAATVAPVYQPQDSALSFITFPLRLITDLWRVSSVY